MLARLKSSASQIWLALQYREQAALLVCATAILAFVFYIGVAQPLIDYRDATARQLATQEARFQRILGLLAQTDAPDAAETAPQGNNKGDNNGDDVRSNVLALAQDMQLNIDRIQAGNGNFTLSINAAAPQKLFAWLARINSELRAEPITLTLRKTAARGTLSAQISFQTRP